MSAELEQKRKMTKAKWEADRIKGKYRMMFEELSKDLHTLVYQHKIDGTVANLNTLKLVLANTMNRYKDKMFKIKEVKVK